MGTQNEVVAESIKSGVAKGYDLSDVAKPKTEAEARCEKLAEQVPHYYLLYLAILLYFFAFWFLSV